MTDERSGNGSAALEEAAGELQRAAAAKKCWACGCLHGALETIERVLPAPERPAALTVAVAGARATLTAVRYDCLGCDVCFPALAVNAIHASRGEPLAAQACPTESVEVRAGWPPLPGAYTVLRYQAPVAVCTLTDEGFAATVAREADPSVAIVGTLQTENLGIERIIRNMIANPKVRFLVVVGTDSRQAIGHLPGQSLIALARDGIDAAGRIVGAQGKRPVLRNITRDAVEHFRRAVEVVDLIGTVDVDTVMAAVRACVARPPGPVERFAGESVVTPLTGHLPSRLISDPAGYFVIYVDRPRHRLSLEHYRNEGVLNAVIDGDTAAEVYTPAIERGLLSRLDHAAYLGRELTRAERALMTNEPYIQDAAPASASLPRTAPQPATPTSCCGTSAESHETCSTGDV